MDGLFNFKQQTLFYQNNIKMENQIGSKSLVIVKKHCTPLRSS